MRAVDVVGGDVFPLFCPEFADEGRLGGVVDAGAGARGDRRGRSGLMIQGGSGNRRTPFRARGHSAWVGAPFRVNSAKTYRDRPNDARAFAT